MILNNIIILHLFLKLRLIICLVRLDNSQWLTCVKTSERGVKNHWSLGVKKKTANNTLRPVPHRKGLHLWVLMSSSWSVSLWAEFVHCLFKWWKSVWHWVCCVCDITLKKITLNEHKKNHGKDFHMINLCYSNLMYLRYFNLIH